ncbi:MULTISPECIES: 3-keto-5-aminohexanoate cleavage protein [unclassified Bradyrhizobium]|uniref:3-keto-5-aminohexanoate cleavage protein n=1 Tax=unclassified Bradyrhizobium TaxID=2631580 RepID=UPI0020B1BF04|nr:MULTISPECIES: 3-keto-5-aminohexanoate cleavage protein [unclassified Bradyrhizobium]MCP3380587.1 3-keto-5-aminohexanoate cleavage protein [Bradyrhizobium sp. CCGUVB4N]MCP3441454.1 3-keto-5-aminohexanoate cleavage protein [Bradyrhizobium sp. CCGUVB14]
MNVKRKIIVTIAPTGGVVKKSKNPHLPTQPSEIAEDVYRCYDAGASIVALHARRQDDGATCSSEIYQDINSRIRTKCCIVINNSTGGGIDGDMVRSIGPGLDEVIFEQRLQGFEAGADMATFGAHTVLASFGGREIFVNTSPTRCDIMAKRFQKTGIKPEWECFSLSHLLQDPIRLINKGFDKPPYWINFVLGADRGIQGGLPYTPQILDMLIGNLPKGAMFCVSGVGRAQLPATTHAVLAGGHVRVGLEDNLYLEPGILATNVRLVERTVRIIRELGYEPATAVEARTMLGLAPRK